MRRINLKKIIAIVLAGLLLIGAFGAIVTFAKNDTRSIGAGNFSVGTLSETDGLYVKDDTAIYTKNAIECQGLRIKPEFDSNVTFQIFWYNEDELYIDCTEKTTLPSAQFVDGVPVLAKYCRIVIYPSQLDEEGNQIKDFKVGFFDIRKIVKNLNITVNKKQEYEPFDIFANLTKYTESLGTKNEVLLNGKNIHFENSAFSTGYDSNLNEANIGKEEGYDIIKIECEDIAIYKVDLRDGSQIHCLFYDSQGNYISDQRLSGKEIHYLEVPSLDDNLIIVLSIENLGENCSMTAYMPR